jgi:hypothetical protein
MAFISTTHGCGRDRSLGFPPARINYGNIGLGQQAKRVVIVVNASGNSVEIGSITFSVTLGDASQFSADQVCPAKLMARKSCLIGVIFTPGRGRRGRSHTQHRDQCSRQPDRDPDPRRREVNASFDSESLQAVRSAK